MGAEFCAKKPKTRDFPRGALFQNPEKRKVRFLQTGF
jgi:hypothetical protein